MIIGQGGEAHLVDEELASVSKIEMSQLLSKIQMKERFVSNQHL
jgi:hypothetical protein